MLNGQSLLDSFTPESLETIINPEISQRLGLYQVFLRLYDQNRGLLDEILQLETAGGKSSTGLALPYLQGVMVDEHAYLVTNVLKGTSQILQQPQHIWTIGRDSRKVLIPIQDQRLSRCHAAIRYIPREGFLLVDLGSSNGSYVNSEPIRQVTRLKDGDRIRLGNTCFSFFVCQAERQLPSVSPELLALVQSIGTGATPRPSRPFSPALAREQGHLPDGTDHSLAHVQEDTVLVNWDELAASGK